MNAWLIYGAVGAFVIYVGMRVGFPDVVKSPVYYATMLDEDLDAATRADLQENHRLLPTETIHALIVKRRKGHADEHVLLTRENARAIFIPAGCAHGFQTLVDDCDVVYQMTDYYAPELGSGIRWEDSILGIQWPMENVVMNNRDREYADLDKSWLRSMSWD